MVGRTTTVCCVKQSVACLGIGRNTTRRAALKAHHTRAGDAPGGAFRSQSVDSSYEDPTALAAFYIKTMFLPHSAGFSPRDHMDQ